MIVHPETGEVLETREDFLQAMAALEERLAPLYRLRRLIRDGWADKYAIPGMPEPRSWTTIQQQVAKCPRCRMTLKGDFEEEGGQST